MRAHHKLTVYVSVASRSGEYVGNIRVEQLTLDALTTAGHSCVIVQDGAVELTRSDDD